MSEQPDFQTMWGTYWAIRVDKTLYVHHQSSFWNDITFDPATQREAEGLMVVKTWLECAAGRATTYEEFMAALLRGE